MVDTKASRMLGIYREIGFIKITMRPHKKQTSRKTKLWLFRVQNYFEIYALPFYYEVCLSNLDKIPKNNVVKGPFE